MYRARVILVNESERKPTRSVRRHVLALPVQLARGSGLTRDVSAGGVYPSPTKPIRWIRSST